MKIKINFYSFLLSFVCIALFLIAVSSSQLIEFVTYWVHIHPLNIVLSISIITFLFGLIGFSGVNNWKSLLRSISTVIITSGLYVLTLFIIFMGNLYKFN